MKNEGKGVAAVANATKPRGPKPYKYPKVKVDLPNNEFDYSDLYSSKANYTVEQKLAAVTAYVMTGSCTETAKLCGFKQLQTVSEWKLKATWWPDAYMAVKKDKNEEMDSTMTSIIHTAANEILDRLKNGDEVLDKDGNLRRKKMGGKEVATVMGITFDKRALLRGDPTSRTEKIDTTKVLGNIREQLAEIARDHLDKHVVKEVH